jgi:hypothetical protein
MTRHERRFGKLRPQQFALLAPLDLWSGRGRRTGYPRFQVIDYSHVQEEIELGRRYQVGSAVLAAAALVVTVASPRGSHWGDAGEPGAGLGLPGWADLQCITRRRALMRASGLAIGQTRARPLAGEHCMALDRES